jgi:hypothetical protein
MKIKVVSLFVIISFCAVSCLYAQKKVVLDNYYNHEFNGTTGKPFHYLWEDTEMSGFSQFGKLFTDKGAILSTLKTKPTSSNLKEADVFILVDPDTKLETRDPHYMDAQAANVISNWVKAGGRLLLLTNDGNHAELDCFNLLAAKFGMTFGKEMLHPEKAGVGKSRDFNSCASTVLPNHPLFKGVSKIFLKEIAPINCLNPAKPVLEEGGKAIIAEAKYGKGYVLAVGDPWLYNEYIDHAFLPADFQNLAAAENLVDLLLKSK